MKKIPLTRSQMGLGLPGQLAIFDIQLLIAVGGKDGRGGPTRPRDGKSFYFMISLTILRTLYAIEWRTAIPAHLFQQSHSIEKSDLTVFKIFLLKFQKN